MSVQQLIKITDEYADDLLHIRGCPSQGHITLCGWTDVSHEYVDINKDSEICQTCLDIIKYCKRIRVK